jgi:hypothetical protein
MLIPSNFFTLRNLKLSVVVPSRLRAAALPTGRSDRPEGLLMTSDSGRERKFWQIALTDLERQLGAGRNGISSAEAAVRRLRYGPNTLEERRRLSLPLKFLSRFRNRS